MLLLKECTPVKSQKLVLKMKNLFPLKILKFIEWCSELVELLIETKEVLFLREINIISKEFWVVV